MKGFENMPVRFFAYDAETQDIEEVSEADFIEAEGVITYERHTVFENGCKQICLTKNSF